MEILKASSMKIYRLKNETIIGFFGNEKGRFFVATGQVPEGTKVDDWIALGDPTFEENGEWYFTVDAVDAQHIGPYPTRNVAWTALIKYLSEE